MEQTQFNQSEPELVGTFLVIPHGFMEKLEWYSRLGRNEQLVVNNWLWRFFFSTKGGKVVMNWDYDKKAWEKMVEMLSERSHVEAKVIWEQLKDKLGSNFNYN